MSWKIYDLNIPAYIVCQYMTLILAALSIVMTGLFLTIVLKGLNLTSGSGLKFSRRLAYALDDRHIYGLIVHLRILSLICIPICLWLVADNFEQVYVFESGSTMVHSSAFGVWHMMPYVLFHALIVGLLVWEKIRPASNSYVAEKTDIMEGYHAERAKDAFAFKQDRIRRVK